MQEAEQQLQANEHAWAPPGTFAAALSTFTAALQDAIQTTDNLKQELDIMASRAAKADSNAQAADVRQQQLEDQLSKATAKTQKIQQLSDSSVRNLTAAQKQLASLQGQVAQVSQQRDQIAARLNTAEGKLQELATLQPKLAKVRNEAEACKKEMSTLSGSQAKVHESLQAYLKQEKELRQGLSAAEHHLDRVSQDYAVCQDTFHRLHFDMRQTKTFWRKTLAATATVCCLICTALLWNRSWLHRKMSELELRIDRLKSKD